MELNPAKYSKVEVEVKDEVKVEVKVKNIEITRCLNKHSASIHSDLLLTLAGFYT
jgi:hypothetical protein